ncbi:MAG: hypothetical protein JST00_13610 [Deltaproteobacteria bacterium]|nr:hypothetical protein [Deltaproteobacteria bacterium]
MTDGRCLRGIVVEAFAAGEMTRLRMEAYPSQRKTVVAADGSAFWTEEGMVVLTAHPVMRRLLRELARQRDTAPSTAISAHALALAVWPGETFRGDTAKRRVQSLVHRLRRLGLGENISASGSYGYWLSPEVEVRA